MDALVLAEEAERLAADFTFWVAVSVGRKGEVSCVGVCLGGGKGRGDIRPASIPSTILLATALSTW